MTEPHRCHAEGCDTTVPRAMLMCGRHWRLVPGLVKAAVWATYVDGQEERLDPSEEYLDAAQRAVEAVAAQEGRR